MLKGPGATINPGEIYYIGWGTHGYISGRRICHQEYIIGKEGRVSNSVYHCANALRIIKFSW